MAADPGEVSKTESKSSGTAHNGAVELYWTVQHPVAGSQPDSKRLLLISGLGSPLVAFEPEFVAELCAAGFSVARFDNRDVGKSSRIEGPSTGSPPYSIDDMASDAVAVLDAIGWASAHVFGQSMGGMIAQQLAITHPARLQSLIAVMTASGERGFGKATEEAAAALLRPAPGDADGWLEHRLETEQIWASPQHWSPEWVRKKGRSMIEHGVDSKGAIRQYRAIASAGSRDQQLATISAPTLVLHGSADTLIQPDGGRHLAEVIPGASYVEIEGMGHDLPPALWGRIVSEVEQFLAT
ncbi:MAG: alpha/beta fold hydrolase [Acidimicrobiales bacterium]